MIGQSSAILNRFPNGNDPHILGPPSNLKMLTLSLHFQHEHPAPWIGYNFQNLLVLPSLTLTSEYLCKVTNRNTKTRCEMFSKLTVKTPERRQWLTEPAFEKFDFDPFDTVFYFYINPLKMSENVWLPDVFRGHKNGSLTWNRFT